MASPIRSPPPESASDAQTSPHPPLTPPPPQHPAANPSPMSNEILIPPPTAAPAPNHSGDSSSPMPSQAPVPPSPPTIDRSPPLTMENGTPQSRPLPPPAPAPPAPPSAPAQASPESMLEVEGEAAQAAGESENMTLAFALAQTEAIPPTPPKVAEEVESSGGSPQEELALTIAKLLNGEVAAVTEPKLVVDKVASPVTTTSVVSGGGRGVGSKRWLQGGVPEKVRRAELRRAELGFRVAAAVFCLLSLSVMVADTTPGWSGDSFRRYNEYRYTFAASVLAFTYSGFQLVKEVHYLVTGKRMIRDPWAKLKLCFLGTKMNPTVELGLSEVGSSIPLA
ncbi:hypothetical protein GUJ93_ZPchr0007g5506 [Zizania palustris]|uniref:CASP-like protein n=1 Tax=Zizania palustris TaxID=103762 RepID=A0A8J5VR26_ZIZPA|nr:hypothetical protein GUJ93_ZPchr0007g5506 [Zizania palustris]